MDTNVLIDGHTYAYRSLGGETSPVWDMIHVWRQVRESKESCATNYREKLATAKTHTTSNSQMINCLYGTFETPLGEVSHAGDLEAMRWLIENYNAPITAETMLMACLGLKTASIQLLLQLGANPTWGIFAPITAGYEGARQDDVIATVRLLVEGGADLTRTKCVWIRDEKVPVGIITDCIRRYKSFSVMRYLILHGAPCTDEQLSFVVSCGKKRPPPPSRQELEAELISWCGG